MRSVEYFSSDAPAGSGPFRGKDNEERLGRSRGEDEDEGGMRRPEEEGATTGIREGRGVATTKTTADPGRSDE